MKIMLTLLGLCLSVCVSAASLNKIVVFGDSLSDNGNLYEYMKHQMPLSPPYYEGRFTNGLAWVELLTQLYYPADYQAHLLDYAFGGAGVMGDNGEDDDDTLFTLRREVDSYLLAHEDKADENSLFVMWMGANNYLAVSDDIEQTIQDVNWGIKANLERLVAKGAKHFLIINLPDLGLTPAARDFDAPELLSYYSTQHNARLASNVKQLQMDYPNVQWIYYDVNNMLGDMLQNPANYGLTNTQDTCYEAMMSHRSSKPILTMVSTIKPRANKNNACEGYLFFDPVHPAAVAHEIMATRIHQLFQENGVEFQ